MSNTAADEAINLRIDLLNNQFELDPETVAFINLVRERTQALARELYAARPTNYDPGRFVAATDGLHHAAGLFCDAVVLGDELSRRRKKRAVSND